MSAGCFSREGERTETIYSETHPLNELLSCTGCHDPYCISAEKTAQMLRSCLSLSNRENSMIDM